AQMAQYRLSMNQVLGALASANQNLPGGYLDIGRKRFNLTTWGSFASIDQIKDTIVQAAQGQVVRLKDVAEVFFTHEDQLYSARLNGERAVFVTVQQRVGANIFQVRRGLDEKLEMFSRQMSDKISLHRVFDQAESVKGRLNGFFVNLLQGLLLVGLVIFTVVGIRASAIVMSVIPLSLLIGIGLIDLNGYGLQQMTIAGLIIALGMLVDNAIVVTTNVSRFMQLGYKRMEAAAEGTSQIGWAVVSSTITTVLAFVPMMLMRDHTGDFIRSMPLIVSYTLMASLFLALTFTPYLSSRFIYAEKLPRFSLRPLLDRFIDTNYRAMLSRSLAHPRKVVLSALSALLLSLALFPLIGVSFFPKAEKPQLMININTPRGTSLQETNRIVAEIEEKLATREEIQYYAANVGHGNPRIYYNVIPRRERSTHAQIFVQLRKWHPKAFYALVADLRREMRQIPGARIEVKEFEQGPPVEAPIAVRILGDQLDVLKELSTQVEAIFNTTPGTLNIVNPLATAKTDLHIAVNRDKAG
ncbi:MAG: efflux RND transporter permease subunit, partial [Calditrichaeota bacterium]